MYKIGDEFTDTGLGEKKHFKILNVSQDILTQKSGKKRAGKIIYKMQNLLVVPEEWELELRKLATKLKYFNINDDALNELITRKILKLKDGKT